MRMPLLRGSSVLSEEISQLCMPSKLRFDGDCGEKKKKAEENVILSGPHKSQTNAQRQYVILTVNSSCRYQSFVHKLTLVLQKLQSGQQPFQTFLFNSLVPAPGTPLDLNVLFVSVYCVQAELRPESLFPVTPMLQ